MKTFDVEMKIPFGQYTLEEYDIWIAEQTTSMRNMLIVGGFFKPAETYEQKALKDVMQNLQKDVDSPYLILEVNDDHIQYDYSSCYIPIKALRRKVFEQGYAGLHIIYKSRPPQWAWNEAFRYEARIPAELFNKQDSISITLMEEQRGRRYVQIPNPDTKWGRFFSEVEND